MRSLVRILVLAPVFALVLSCGSQASDNDSLDAGPLEVVLSPSLRLPERDPAFVAARLVENLVYLDFNAPPEVSITPGTVVAGESETGYLRKVLGVVSDGNNLVLETEPASLTNAIEQAQFLIPISMKGMASRRPDRSHSDAARLPVAQYLSASIPLEEYVVGGPGEGVKVDGSLSVEIDADIEIRIENSKLVLARLVTRPIATLTMKLIAELSGSTSAEGSIDLATNAPTVNFLFFVGWLPIKGTLNLEVLLGYNVTASGQMSASAGLSVTATGALGMEYREGEWSPIRTWMGTATAIPGEGEATASASIKAYIKPEAKIKFYGLAGPVFNVERSATFKVAADGSDSCATWSVVDGYSTSATLQVGDGASINILDATLPLTYEVASTETNTTIAEGQLGVCMDAGTPDAGLSDAALGDAALGDAALGDAALGDAALGDAALGDAGGCAPTVVGASSFVIEVAESTTGGVLTSFGDVSINASGTIAMTGADTEGTRLWSNAVGGETVLLSFPTVTNGRRFSGASINNMGSVASNDRVDGPSYRLRIWKSNGTNVIIGRTDSEFGGASRWVDINTDGTVAHTATAKFSESTTGYLQRYTNEGAPENLVSWTGAAQVRPQIDDAGRLVYRGADAILRLSSDSGPGVALASSCNTIGDKPGISATGGAIAFVGDCGSGPLPHLVVPGISATPIALVDASQPLSNYASSSRVGVSWNPNACGSSADEYEVTAAFLADSAAGRTLVLASIVYSGTTPGSVKTSSLITVGDTITGAPTTTVTAIRDAVDPMASNGNLTWIVDFADGSAAVLRLTRVVN